MATADADPSKSGLALPRAELDASESEFHEALQAGPTAIRSIGADAAAQQHAECLE